jgi:uncharacterized protein
VRFAYEFQDDWGNWLRAYGSENREYEEHGLNRTRQASINDPLIKEAVRKFRCGPQPADHHGLSDLGL